MSTWNVSPEAGFKKRLMRPATWGTRRYAPNNLGLLRRRRDRRPRSSACPAMKNSAPHTIRTSMVWPKSGSITRSATSVSNSTIAIEVAGISGRLVDSAKSHAAITTKAGLADLGRAWTSTPSSVIQRREPFTSGPNASVATIRRMLHHEHQQRERGGSAWATETTPRSAP